MTAILLALLFSLDVNSRPAPPRPPVVAKALTACMAVTRADVELALARKVSRGEEESANGSSTCDYAGGGGQVTVTIQHLGAPPDMAQEKRSLQGEFPGSSIREASVPGGDAFFLDLAGAGTMMYVIRGGRDYVLVAILGFGEPAQVSDAAARLARAALARL